MNINLNNNLDALDEALNTQVAALMSKGWRSPEAYLKLTAQESERLLVIRADHPVSDSYDDMMHKTFRNPHVPTLFADCASYIAGLASTEQAEQEAYRKAIARTLELGVKLNVRDDWMAQLRAQMTALSENVIAYKGDVE